VGCKRSPGPEAFAVLVVVSEATDFIAVVFAVAFSSTFSAQKSHVKPQNG
jgi:hypothetical protein